MIEKFKKKIMIRRFTKDFNEEIIEKTLIKRGYSIKSISRIILDNKLKESLPNYNRLNNYVKSYKLAWRNTEDFNIIINEIKKVLIENKYVDYLENTDRLGAYETINSSNLYGYSVFEIFTRELSKQIDEIL